MFEQINSQAQISSQMLNASKQFADAAFKAQGIAFEGFEKAVSLQVKAVENRWNATLAFFGEAADLTSPEGMKDFLPKGVALVRETAEKNYATSQELVNVSVKTSEALTSLAKGQFEAANETFVKPVAVAARKTK
ncbi:MAG: phasin family protein [Pseudomonadota bacterium]|nr:phasin family protein [Pseudomonadota bacterium]